MTKLLCPHCRRPIGGPARKDIGQFSVRLATLLVDPETGAVHGPCTECGGDVAISATSTLAPAMALAVSSLGPGSSTVTEGRPVN